MKRKLGFLILLTVTIIIAMSQVCFAEDKSSIDRDYLNKGIIKISFKSDTKKTIKVMIKKDETTYVYSLSSDGKYATYPLQMGNGVYKVYILENIQGNSYNPIYTEDVDLELKDEKEIYINSVQNINWDMSMKSIKQALLLTKKLKNDVDKVKAIYNFIVPNFKYDFVKWENIKSYPNPYIPVIDNTYAERKGICYDYSALFASMLRCINIPVKLDMGYSKYVKEYHAWNEVYIQTTKKWMIIDTTYDSQAKAAKIKFTMAKDSDSYKTVKSY